MEPETPAPPPVANLERKARLLLLIMVLLVAGAVLFLMYARGAFERTQQVVLIAEDSEGVSVGMDVTFSGFPIGRVGSIELGPDGNARITVRVPLKDARWLRTSSVFTMETGLVGGTRIRAFSGVMTDPPLPDGAERRVLRGDIAAEIPRMLASVRELVGNISNLSASDAPLALSLRNLQTATERLSGPKGMLGALLGNDNDAQQISQALARTNALLARLDGVVVRADGIAQKADSIAARTDTLVANANTQVFGQEGLMPQAQSTVVQLNGLLADTRGTLKRVDAVLVEAQAIAANTREATTDLGALRTEVDANLRKIEHLVNEINRKWPFARETEIKLP